MAINPAFPFTAKFQAGLLNLLMRDYDYMRSIIEDLNPQHFDAGESHIKLFKLIKAYWGLSKKPVTLEIIRNSIKTLEEKGSYSEGTVFGLNNVIDAGKNLTSADYDYIRTNSIDFLKKQTMAVAFSGALEYYDNNDYDALYKVIGEAYKKSFDVGSSIGINYLTESVHDRYSEPPRADLWSTGFEQLDNFIDGGMARKEAYTIISSTGRGKTSLLCNFAISAVKQKKKTLFVTLEMSDKQIAQRMDSILCGFSASELSTMPEARIDLQHMIDTKLNGSLPIIKQFDRGQLSVAGLHTYLERFSMDFGTPDVVILDWLGCMRLPNNEKKHEALAEVADAVINMSREFNCSILNAHQSNRQAVGNDIFGYGAVSESFSSLFGMDLVLSLGATDQAKDAGKRTLSISKNRFGPDSVYVRLQGSKPDQPLTFKFTEIPREEEEAELLAPEDTTKWGKTKK